MGPKVLELFLALHIHILSPTGVQLREDSLVVTFKLTKATKSLEILLEEFIMQILVHK